MSNNGRVFILEVTDRSGKKTHFVDKPVFVLGRGDASAVKFDDVNISRDHAKILFDEVVKIQDLKSSNGTFVNGKQIDAMTSFALNDDDVIQLGHSTISFKIKSIVPANEGKKAFEKAELPEEKPEIKIKISGFPNVDQELKFDFKNVQVDLPKYRDASEHAREIVSEANYVKETILKGALVRKEQILNEASLESKGLADKAYQEYRERISSLISETKISMQRLKIETESHLDDKKLHALREIEHLWEEHQKQIDLEKKSIIQRLKDENRSEYDLELERLNNQILIEKMRILTEAEATVMKNTVAYRSQFENEKNEHEEKIKLLSKQIEDLKFEQVDTQKKLEILKKDLHLNQIDYEKTLSNLKIEKERFEAAEQKHAGLTSENSKIQENLNNYNKTRDAAIEAEQIAKKSSALLSKEISDLVLKKEQIKQQLSQEEKNLSDLKRKAKVEVDEEFQNLRKVEEKKFEDFKVNELKELQKIRLDHTKSFNKFSLELSQEIASKLKMQSKSGSDFNFEKHLEIINSVIQVKSSEATGVESKHQDQIDSWKKNYQSEKVRHYFSGAMVAVLVYVSGNFVYSKLSVDSLKQDQARTLEIQRQQEIENKFVAEKTTKLFDSYVDATIYTEDFKDTYLDESLQNEWVKAATLYFLHTWKIDEQKTIQVISNSRSLVQNIDEASKKLTKTRLKSEIEKLKDLESKNVASQVEILGTHVKYEAYKKFEKQFFKDKLSKRLPANR